jgi:hypothetical protein
MRASLVTTLVSLALLIGCAKPTQEIEPLPPAPRIIALSATPGVVQPDGQVTLSWETENATSIELHRANEGVVSGATATTGSVQVNSSEDGLFVLVASNARLGRGRRRHLRDLLHREPFPGARG